MAQLPKNISSVINSLTPDGMAKLAESCRNSATMFKEAAVLLSEAADAYGNNDPTTALELLRHAQDRLNRKD